LQPERGNILLNGQDISSIPIHERANRGIGYLAQEPSVFRHLSVEDNILCILETLEEDKNSQLQRLESLLEELQLTPLRKKKASTLSGGERRRLEITRCLIRRPSILLLDEPFANIDPLAIQEVKKLVRMLKKKDISILITDHNAREIFSVVDRSYIIQNGELMIEGTPKELTQNADAKKYYLGDDFIL
jgi:lipopolysaccharide export system ATP-binding protein